MASPERGEYRVGKDLNAVGPASGIIQVSLLPEILGAVLCWLNVRTLAHSEKACCIFSTKFWDDSTTTSLTTHVHSEYSEKIEF